MNYFVVLTEECDLECSYCHGKACDDEDHCASKNPKRQDKKSSMLYEFVPSEITYKTWQLERFCRKDPDCGIIFYGGEPLLRMGRMIEIMDRVPAKRFILQTNALKLHDLPSEYMKKLQGIQISVDGDRPTTDGYRGRGVYNACISNARVARTNGFKGELIARMTVAERTNIYKQVLHLIGLDKGKLFDAVHWQLDAMFGPDYEKRDFAKWVKRSYKPGIEALAKKWLALMKRGQVMRIYPFLGIMQSLLNGDQSRLRCGAGYAHYAIQTDGRIVPCPVMLGMKRFYAGDLKTHPSKLKQFDVGDPCTACDIRGVCGGRCLYGNYFKHWGMSGYSEVCGTVKHLISTLKGIEPEVRKLIESGKIRPKDLNYTKFNSCEIIP
jgi:putative peptide-modifying radical SAM enzyme